MSDLVARMKKLRDETVWPHDESAWPEWCRQIVEVEAIEKWAHAQNMAATELIEQRDEALRRLEEVRKALAAARHDITLGDYDAADYNFAVAIKAVVVERGSLIDQAVVLDKLDETTFRCPDIRHGLSAKCPTCGRA